MRLNLCHLEMCVEHNTQHQSLSWRRQQTHGVVSMSQASTQKQWGNSNSLSFDRSSSQSSQTLWSSSSSGSSKPLFLCHNVWIKHFAGSMYGASTPGGSNTVDSRLKTPCLVDSGGWREQTEKQKQSVSVFHFKPRVRSIDRSSSLDLQMG